MTQQATSDLSDDKNREQQVVDYLLKNPGFINQHPKVLAALELQHTTGTAVSLIERQVITLREQNIQLKNQLQELLSNARENDQLHNRMHQLTLKLINRHTLSSLLETLHEHLHTDLNADVLIAHLNSKTKTDSPFIKPMTADKEVEQLFDVAYDAGKPSCGRLKKTQLDFLFDKAAGDIASAAIIPLGSNASAGLLAIGSRDADRFNPGMGTLFLTQLGEIFSQLLHRVDSSAD
ncbi:MAG: DUF484 family protein [Gammaproteobacteria bacterium]